MVKNWAKETPDNFRLTAKFRKVITHDKHLVDVDEVSAFLNNIEPLQEKTRPSNPITTFNANNTRTGRSKGTCSSFR